MSRYNTGYSSDKQREHNKEMIELELWLVNETDKAILVETDDEVKCWLPKSQIEVVKEGLGLIKFGCPRWLAEERKLV